jgi:hypothetical protein
MIVTEYRPKPVPTNSFDWTAHYADKEELGCGFGSTEAKAIENLKSLPDDD